MELVLIVGTLCRIIDEGVDYSAFVIAPCASVPNIVSEIILKSTRRARDCVRWNPRCVRSRDLRRFNC